MAPRGPKSWGSWLGAQSASLVVGDPLHWDHGGPGLVLRSHPRKQVVLELSQAPGNPPAPAVATSLAPSLGLSSPSGCEVGWMAGWEAAILPPPGEP